MRLLKRIYLLPLSCCIVALAQGTPASTAMTASADRQALASRIFDRERQTIQHLGSLRPVVQIYIQSTKQNDEPANGDVYFLGEWNVSSVFQSDMQHRVMPHVALIAGQRGRSIGPRIGNRYTFHPDALTQMFFVDAAYFSSDYYSLTYERDEKLSGIHLAVFRVKPIPEGDLGRVEGHIWVEPQSASIVRIHGRFTGEANRDDGNPEFDSWRQKSPSGWWLPNYLYSESTAQNPADNLTLLRMRMTIEVWGYNRPLAAKPTSVPGLKRRVDAAAVEPRLVQWLSENALVAPHGDPDGAICAVARTLMRASAIPERKVSCRILMSSPVESFSVGETIVFSRGLLDLLPDEGALAAVVAHEVAHILLGHTDPPAVNCEGDIFERGAVPRAMKFHTNANDEKAARALAADLLRKSPYENALNRLQEFAAAIRLRRNETPRIFRAPFGGNVVTEILALADQVTDHEKVKAGALALGSRVEFDPWTDALSFSTKYRAIAARVYPFGVAARIPELQAEMPPQMESDMNNHQEEQP